MDEEKSRSFSVNVPNVLSDDLYTSTVPNISTISSIKLPLKRYLSVKSPVFYNSELCFMLLHVGCVRSCYLFMAASYYSCTPASSSSAAQLLHLVLRISISSYSRQLQATACTAWAACCTT